MKMNFLFLKAVIDAGNTAKKASDVLLTFDNFPSIDDLLSKKEEINEVAEECKKTALFKYIEKDAGTILIIDIITKSAEDKKEQLLDAVTYFYTSLEDAKTYGKLISSIIELTPVIAHFVNQLK